METLRISEKESLIQRMKDEGFEKYYTRKRFCSDMIRFFSLFHSKERDFILQHANHSCKVMEVDKSTGMIWCGIPGNPKLVIESCGNCKGI